MFGRAPKKEKRTSQEQQEKNKLKKRISFRARLFFRHLEISPAVGALIAIGIFLAGSALLIYILSLLGKQAEEQRIRQSFAEPAVCAGWTNASAATHVDVLGSGSVSDFSIGNSAYHKTAVRKSDQDAIQNVSGTEPLRIVCKDFSLENPDLFDIRSIALEVSFGAEIMGEPDDVLSFEYSLDGDTWQQITSYVLAQSTGNKDRGGYIRFSLDGIVSSKTIGNLQVRASFHERSQIGRTQVYVDGMRLALETQKKLAVPDVPERVIRMAKFEFSAFEQPTFDFQVEERGIPLFTKRITRTVKAVQVVDPAHQVNDNVVTLGIDREQRWEQYTLDTNVFSKPGKYTITVVYEENGEERTFSQEFSWGVLAINPDKSMYTVGEDANFSIGVLDDGGDIVCDADVELQITAPSGVTTKLSTENGDIIVTEFCRRKEEFREPDYHTTYNITELGEHVLTLSATHANGTFSITDSFTVVGDTRFSVQRHGPTRVFPKVWQPMELRVTAYEAFSGEVKDWLPDGFEIESSDQYIVSEVFRGKTTDQQIAWKVDLEEGENATFRYRFKPPEISPAFYVLGPAEVGDWKEARVWQIAVDPTYLYLLATTGTGLPSGWVLDTGSDGKYVRAASTAGGTGGNPTHDHTFTESRSTGASLNYTGSGSTVATTGHTHTSSSDVVAANNDPAHHTFYLWKYNTTDSTPTTIPDNTFILFDNGSGDPTSPWSRYSTADNKLIKIDSSFQTGGDDNHTHSINWGSLGASSGSAAVSSTADEERFAADNHTHGAPSSSSTDSTSLLPPYSTFKIYEQTSATPQDIPDGTVALFDGTPPTGWTTISGGAPSQNNLLRGSDTAGSTGGSSATTHANTVSGNSQLPSSTIFSLIGFTSSRSRYNHSHTITLSAYDSPDPMPLYEDYILAEFDAQATINISGNVLGTNESSFIGSPPCNGTTEALSIKVNGSGSATTTCANTTGAYTFSGVSVSAGDTVSIYLNSNSTPKANLNLVVGVSNITGADLYQDHVIIRDEWDGESTILDMIDYDNDQNPTDMLYDADDLATDDVTLDSNVELHIWTGDTFDPNGKVTTQGTGDLHIDDSATMNLDTGGVGTESTIAAEISVDTGATLNVTANTKVNGSATAVSVVGTLTQDSGTFDIGNSTDEDINFNAGTLNMNGGTMTVADDFTITSGGTTEDINISGGTVQVNGFFDMDDGTVDVSSTLNIVGAANTGLDVDGGTLTVASDADINITATSSDFLVDGASTTINLNGGSLDTNRYWRWNNGPTINLRGGNHHSGTGGANGTWEMQLSGSVNFYMISGTEADGDGCNITTMNILVYNGGTFDTQNGASNYPTGGTLCLGTTVANRLIYDIETTSHAFWNIYALETSGMHASSAATIPIKNDFKIFSGKTFTGNNDTISVGNDWINNGTYTPNSDTITMVGTAGEINGTSDTTFNNLNIDPSSAGTITVLNSGGDDPTVSGTLTVAASDTLSIGSGRVLTHTGTADVAGTGTISGAGTLRFTSSTTGGPGTTITTLSSLVRFDASSASIPGAVFDARTYAGAVEIYSNSGSGKSVSTVGSGTYAFSSTLTVTTAGVGATTLDMNTTDPTSFTVSAALTIGSTSILSATSSGTFNVNGNYANGGTFTHNSGTVTMNSTSSINGTVDTTFNNLYIGDGSVGTVTINGTDDPTVAGTLTVDAGDTLWIASGKTLTHSGTTDVAGTGTITSSGSGLLIFTSSTTGGPGTAVTLSTAVRFDSSGASIPAAVVDARIYGGDVDLYGNNSSNTITFPSGTFTFNGALTTTQGGTGTTISTANANNPAITVNGSFTIGANTSFSSPSSLTLKGGVTNNGGFANNAGTVLLSGTSQQTVSGFTTGGGGGFNNLTISNNSGSDPDSSPSVIFSSSIDVVGTYAINTSGVKVRYVDTITFFTSGLNLNGSSGAGNQVYFRSSTPGTNYTFYYDAFYSQTLTYVDAQDADSSGGATIDATGTGNVNSGNNINWNFGSMRVAGTVYNAVGSSAFNCSGTNLTINISVNADATPDTGTCTAADGTFEFFVTSPTAADQLVVMYIDGVETQSATSATLSYGQYEDAPMDLYVDYVNIYSASGTTVANSHLDDFDSTNDGDINYDVNTLNLSLETGMGLVVKANYTPGGTITTPASSTFAGTINDGGAGDVVIDSSRTLNVGTYAVGAGGDFDNNGTYTDSATQVTTFTGTTTGFTIDGETSFRNVTFNGSGGGWSFSPASVGISENMIVTAGTLSGTTNISVSGGSITGNGEVNLTGGTVTLPVSGNLGGDTNWIFYNLSLTQSSCTHYTTTATGTGGIKITNTLTDTSCFSLEDKFHTLDAGSKVWELAGATPWTHGGVLVENASTFKYTSTTTVTIIAETYYKLALQPTSGSPVHAWSSGTTTASNDLTIGDGATTLIVTASNNPTLNVGGNFTCTAGATSNLTTGTGTWTVSGNLNLTNCSVAASVGHTFVMDGTGKTLTSASGNGTLQSLTLSGSITLADETHIINKNLVLSGTITAGASTIRMRSMVGTITGGNNTLYNLQIGPGQIPGAVSTLQTSDLTVSNTLTVSATDELTIDSGRTITHTGATLTLSGTINGPGRLTYRSATAFPTGGTLAASLILRMDATSNNQSMGARTDYQLVEIDNSGTTAGRTVTAGTGTSQTLTIGSTLDLLNTGADPSTTIFQLDTYDPTFTVNGNTTINANSALTAPSGGALNLKGDYSNNGTFTDSSGTVTLNGTSTQTFSGSMTGSSDFNNLTITNASASNPDIIFSASAQTAGNFTATTAGTQIQYLAGGTYTFQNIDFNGQATSTRVDLTSSSQGTQWSIDVAGTRSVSYTRVRDSYACGTPPDIDASNGTNFDATNNDCWNINTISFQITDTTVGFGSLTSGASTYATGDTDGSGSEVEAHQITASTSAPNGYVITVYGPTLTSAGGTITAIGGTNTAPNPGNEQFGIRATASGGSGTVSAPYAAAGFAYDGVSAPDEIASSSTNSDVTTYSVRYLGNITALTEAGIYSTDLTYIITPTF